MYKANLTDFLRPNHGSKIPKFPQWKLQIFSLTLFSQKFRESIGFTKLSERPIQKKSLSADPDNRPVLPILSADISAEIGVKM